MWAGRKLFWLVLVIPGASAGPNALLDSPSVKWQAEPTNGGSHGVFLSPREEQIVSISTLAHIQALHMETGAIIWEYEPIMLGGDVVSVECHSNIVFSRPQDMLQQYMVFSYSTTRSVSMQIFEET